MLVFRNTTRVWNVKFVFSAVFHLVDLATRPLGRRQAPRRGGPGAVHSVIRSRSALSLRAGWLALLLVLAPAAPASQSDVWIHVDTRAASLLVMRGQQVVAGFDDISIGRGGASRERRNGDKRTPLGEFRIAKIKEQSDFHRFYIIDYPDEPRARRAVRRGEIDQQTYQAIRAAVRDGRLPPQNTPLGGNLGIHGLGRADPRIHELFNWTQGCIVLTNEQRDRLAQWMRVGTRVVID